MRRGRTLILVFLIIIIGLIVAFVALNAFLNTGAQTDDTGPVFVDVYYAAQNIAQGAPITEDALATLRVPQENLIAVMFTLDELPLLVGKVAKFPLDQGVVITETMVS
ncbi:MAG: SAF domain-containing protein, partial [Anaerolineales bacterium]|nr:SAF domain-containing protein [Anaerolineales bacterium]